MFKVLKNKKGMTIVEVVVAVAIIVLMIWVFAPFITATFKQIAQAGELHRTLADNMSILDKKIADVYYGEKTTFPLKITDGTFTGHSADVGGFVLSAGNLSTYYAEVKSYVATNDIFYEGYESDGLYDNYYSIGFLPSSWLESFFEFLANYDVTLTGKNGFEYEVDLSVTYTAGDINPGSVNYMSNVFHVPTTLPDGLGNNDNQAAYLCLTIDKEGLDNWNSPYTLEIKKWYLNRWLSFTDELLPIKVRLPVFSSVGESGYERVAAKADYWVDKNSYTDSNYGSSGITVTRLPAATTFNDITWYESDSITGRYYTVGNNGNLWYREDGVSWTKISLTGITENLNRIKYVNGKFIAIGEDSTILVSNDGLNWTNRSILLSPFTTESLTALSTNNSNQYLIMSNDGATFTTTDFMTYSSTPASATGLSGVNDVMWTGSYYIAVGDNELVAYSTDGANWTKVNTGVVLSDASGNFNSVMLYSTLGIIVGDDGQIHNFHIVTGNDISGWSWSTAVEPVSTVKDLNDVAFARMAFVAVGDDGYVQYSSDGVNWSSPDYMNNYNTTYDIKAVAGLN